MRTRPDTSAWTFASGRSAALEARMVPKSFFERLVEATSKDDVGQRLSDTLAAERLGSSEQLLRADQIARQAYRVVMEQIRSDSPQGDVADLLLAIQDLRSLRNAIKRVQFGVDVSPVPSRYGDEAWQRLWADQQTELPPLFGAVVRHVREALASAPDDLSLFDAAFDSACLLALCAVARSTGSEFITEYFRRYDMARGVELFWRARALGMPEELLSLLVGGRQDRELFAALLRLDEEQWPDLFASHMDGLAVGRIASAQRAQRIREFVRAADAWLMEFARRAKHVAFGPERVFGCLVGLDAEAFNVGLAAAGRASDIEPALLHDHLRDCYV